MFWKAFNTAYALGCIAVFAFGNLTRALHRPIFIKTIRRFFAGPDGTRQPTNMIEPSTEAGAALEVLGDLQP